MTSANQIANIASGESSHEVPAYDLVSDLGRDGGLKGQGGKFVVWVSSGDRAKDICYQMAQVDLIDAIYGHSVKAIRCETASLGTADCAYICRCEDGSDYAIKDSAKDAAMPHSEWFCTRLSEAVGVAAPPCKIVDVQGDNCFGSRWETGHNPKDWWLRAIAKQIDFSLLAPTISRILAMDLFVNNVDRHLTNYIVREMHFGIAMLSFDFSRAWLCNGFPLPPLPMDPTCTTIKALRYLLQEFGNFIILDECNTILDNLEKLPVQTIKQIILEHPVNWLTNGVSDDITNWWQSQARLDRIHSIKEGIKNGHYL